jgi:hypothetical protein
LLRAASIPLDVEEDIDERGRCRHGKRRTNLAQEQGWIELAKNHLKDGPKNGQDETREGQPSKNARYTSQEAVVPLICGLL